MNVQLVFDNPSYPNLAKDIAVTPNAIKVFGKEKILEYLYIALCIWGEELCQKYHENKTWLKRQMTMHYLRIEGLEPQEQPVVPQKSKEQVVIIPVVENVVKNKKVEQEIPKQQEVILNLVKESKKVEPEPVQKVEKAKEKQVIQRVPKAHLLHQKHFFNSIAEGGF